MRMNMFPTCVGLNQHSKAYKGMVSHVPHMRGAEPVLSVTALCKAICSPHAWG